ncbi:MULTISPECIES: DUF6458 family protein [Nonomuraea]|jgi:hypothetical protein|uniref:DUF6458 domain-containing protein n=3 Tax=Nonomuraea TaxID=83681 RepID=A0A7W5YAP0_9ACTN|nr:DUF6458 family protein [Nonomuraea dietziae]MBB3731103.1 hypothetical protein [Nonomuraea dietziae]
MTIAGSIFLIMLGAVLTWAVDWDVAGLDINVVGVILMLGGIALMLFGLYRVRVTREIVAPVETERDRTTVYEERRYTDPPTI